jgi:hypothetical protein
LFVKVLHNRDFTIQKILHCFQVRRFPVPCQPSGRRVIRLDAHLSTAPYVRTTCHAVRTPYKPSIIRPDDMVFCGNYLQRTCDRPDTALKQERFSAKISEILVAQLSVRKAHVHRPDGTRVFHSSHPFEPQPINRGFWALRTARIRY